MSDKNKQQTSSVLQLLFSYCYFPLPFQKKKTEFFNLAFAILLTLQHTILLTSSLLAVYTKIWLSESTTITASHVCFARRRSFLMSSREDLPLYALLNTDRCDDVSSSNNVASFEFSRRCTVDSPPRFVLSFDIFFSR